MDLELTAEEKALLAADDRSTARVGCWALVIVGLLVAFLGVIAVQAIAWLKTGTWPEIALHQALSFVGVERLRFSWVGLERIAVWVFKLPLAVAILGLAVATIFAFTRSDGKQESETLRTARMKRARKNGRFRSGV